MELSRATFDLQNFVAERPFGSDGYSAELIPAVAGSEREGKQGQAEALVIRQAADPEFEDRFRLQDYEKLYAYPGLYDAIVQDRLRCASPKVLAALLRVATQQPVLPTDRIPVAGLRVLDLAAGNGVSGSELRRQGVAHIVGFDYFPVARSAAQRDRPGVYDAYEVGDISDRQRMRSLIEDHRLNALVCSGAVGHLPFEAFTDLWQSFAPGSSISLSYFDATDPTAIDPLHDPRSVVSQYFSMERDAQRFNVTTSMQFTHRLSMAGEPFRAAALAGVKP